MAQITARLSPEERRQFEEYATALGLNGSSLARLLLARALRQSVGAPSPIRRKGKGEGEKLTAHSCKVEAVSRFRHYAAAKKMSPAKAAKAVFERELREQWLAKAVGLKGSSFKRKR